VYLTTLNGIKQQIKPDELFSSFRETKGFWAGMCMRKPERDYQEAPAAGAFARLSDTQHQWEEQYFKRGICRYDNTGRLK